jgi:hypothetical protein
MRLYSGKSALAKDTEIITTNDFVSIYSFKSALAFSAYCPLNNM